MKILFLLFHLVLINVFIDNGFYQLKFESLDGSTINTSSFKGKKVLIAVISSDAKAKSQVQFLDSVQETNSAIQVIIVPTDEFGADVRKNSLKSTIHSRNLLVAAPLKIKSKTTSFQHPLFEWLTQSKKNMHFDNEVGSEGQVYLVSAQGTLYAVLPGHVPREVINKVINQPFNE